MKTFTISFSVPILTFRPSFGRVAISRFLREPFTVFQAKTFSNTFIRMRTTLIKFLMVNLVPTPMFKTVG